ncbi:MAG: UDP-3-O-(3-hydroxymyristoyl)glucosamine N-acyltransferase [Deltaproteobacteria bacterium]|nr:UDP-3-O-(3-hydroxymyristoyl)glucosamine N-acyltransferase [Deltaproteobacteria bacterium]
MGERTLTAAELAGRLGAQVQGEGERLLSGAAGLQSAGPSELAFYQNPRYWAALEASEAGAVLCTAETVAALGERAAGRTFLVCAQPDLAYALALEHFHPRSRPAAGIDPRAFVDPEAQVDAAATVGPLAYVGPGARVGAGTVLMPQAHVGAGASVGADCLLHPHSVVGERCIVGDRVILHAGAVLGADGFGYVLEQGEEGPRHHKVPQVGIVRVEDEVEIGAGSCVDRATTGETLIGRGTKIDNQVQVGHNCQVGPLSILCGQVGMAGSTTLGAGVVLAGGVGLAGHLEVGDGARVGAGAGVIGDVPAGETYSGYPARPHATWLRASAALNRLPELFRRVRALEGRATRKDED